LKIWEDVNELSATVVDRACTVLEDWQEANKNLPCTWLQRAGQQAPSVTQAQQVLHQQLSGTAAVNQQWMPPSIGRFKCNIDAVFSERFKRTGIGVCLRDDTGTFVLAKQLQFNHVLPVAIGEALGLLHALQSMQDMQFDNIDFELDLKVTRDAFHSRNTDVTEFESIIKACRELFSSSFANFRVEFIRRQTNAAAYALAREVTSLASPSTYYVIPSYI